MMPQNIIKDKNLYKVLVPQCSPPHFSLPEVIWYVR